MIQGRQASAIRRSMFRIKEEIERSNRGEGWSPHKVIFTILWCLCGLGLVPTIPHTHTLSRLKELEREYANVLTPKGLTSLIDMSPNTKEAVEKAVKKGVHNSRASAEADPHKRNFFMERVGIVFTPVVEHLLSIPKFQGKSCPEQVVQQVVHRMSAKRKGASIAAGAKSKRKLLFCGSTETPDTGTKTPLTKTSIESRVPGTKTPVTKAKPESPATWSKTPVPKVSTESSATSITTPDTQIKSPIFDKHTEEFLLDAASSWRQARRSNDRQSAARILQMTLKAIPRGQGRVRSWLGPKYFDEVLPVTSGCHVRLVREEKDKTGRIKKPSFRNKYEHSSLGSYPHPVPSLSNRKINPHHQLSMSIVKGIVGAVGKTATQITVKENFGPRFVVRGRDGTEQIVWGKDLRRCCDNPHSRADPYGAKQHNKWNRRILQKVKRGTTVQYRVRPVTAPPSGCVEIKESEAWDVTVVLRVIRSGCHQHVQYTVDSDRCIHDDSVKCTRRMVARARRDNRLWGSGCRSHATFTERFVVSVETFDHLKDWVFSTDFLEPVKATEQATKRGHCFAIREAARTTFERYKATLTLTLTLNPTP